VIEYNPTAVEVRNDPHRYFGELREHCPVHHHVFDTAEVERVNKNPWVAEPTTELFSLFRYDDCITVLQSPALFSSKEGPGPERLRTISEDGMLLFADDPAHRRQRGIANKAFTPRMVANMEPDIRKLADELLDRIQPLGAADLVLDYAVPLTLRVVARIIGVDDSRIDDFFRWSNDTLAAFGADESAVERSFMSMMELHGYLTSIIEPRRAAFGRGEPVPDDVLSALMTAEHESTRLTDEELFMGCQQFMIAGFETTSTALASAVHLLCTHPAQRRKLAENPQLIDVMVEETLRIAAPLEGLCRTATGSTEIGGVAIPRGAKVRVMFASANRDAGQFERPDEFDLDRDLSSLRKHVAFGHGIHSCVGAALARAELRISLSALLARLPDLELDPAGRTSRNPSLLVSGFNRLPIRWTAGRDTTEEHEVVAATRWR
jgi:cytochrome P450